MCSNFNLTVFFLKKNATKEQNRKKISTLCCNSKMQKVRGELRQRQENKAHMSSGPKPHSVTQRLTHCFALSRGPLSSHKLTDRRQLTNQSCGTGLVAVTSSFKRFTYKPSP